MQSCHFSIKRNSKFPVFLTTENKFNVTLQLNYKSFSRIPKALVEFLECYFPFSLFLSTDNSSEH